MRRAMPVVASMLMALAVLPAGAQQSAARDSTREQLRLLLKIAGARPDIDIDFKLGTKQPYNLFGTMTTGLLNSESLEVVLSVTASETISFRVYPHFSGGYINLGRVKDAAGFAHQLLRFNDLNFLFWGVDDSNDVFAGYTVTLESGFPTEALLVVLRSIRGIDKYVGDLRPFIDGSAPVKPD